MNTYYFDDQNFKNSTIYQNFIEENPKVGNLRVRAYAANSAIPIEGLKVVVSKELEGNNIIFFDGYTDSSGVIEKIPLPAPELNSSNMVKPSNTIYTITTTYIPDNINEIYQVRIYDGVCVIQDIIIVPQMKVGGFNGS